MSFRHHFISFLLLYFLSSFLFLSLSLFFGVGGGGGGISYIFKGIIYKTFCLLKCVLVCDAVFHFNVL